MSTWYTLHCKPRKETQVYSYLRSQNVTTYYPTIRVKTINPRAAKMRAFFPRYLFVQAGEGDPSTRLFDRVPGAIGVVRYGDEPATVPDHFIHALKQKIAAVDAAGGLHLDGLKRGDPVRIIEGPFSGYDAIFDMRLSDDDRVQVFLSWLGRQLSVKVEGHYIRKRRRRR